jgi:acetoin:2,6-dichlorophenolindophenol oxidoreductase subunit alpha
VAARITDDPLARTAAWLIEHGIPPATLEADRREATARVSAAVTAAEAAPWPAMQTLFEDVQDAGAPTWQ